MPWTSSDEAHAEMLAEAAERRGKEQEVSTKHYADDVHIRYATEPKMEPPPRDGWPRDGWPRDLRNSKFSAHIEAECHYTVTPEFFAALDKAAEAQRGYMLETYQAIHVALGNAIGRLGENRVTADRIEVWQQDGMIAVVVDDKAACRIELELAVGAMAVVTTWCAPFEHLAADAPPPSPRPA